MIAIFPHLAKILGKHKSKRVGISLSFETIKAAHSAVDGALYRFLFKFMLCVKYKQYSDNSYFLSTDVNIYIFLHMG